VRLGGLSTRPTLAGQQEIFQLEFAGAKLKKFRQPLDFLRHFIQIDEHFDESLFINHFRAHA
jgi:hypothetical protein